MAEFVISLIWIIKDEVALDAMYHKFPIRFKPDVLHTYIQKIQPFKF